MKKILYLSIIVLLLCSCGVVRKIVKTPDLNEKMLELVWEKNFATDPNLDGWQVKNNVGYGPETSRTLFMDTCVSVIPGVGVEITCHYQPGTATTWQGTFDYDWVSGQIESWSGDPYWEADFTHPGIGYIWVADFTNDSSWCAVWIMHEPYDHPVTDKETTTPEIDLAEECRGDICFNVYWGKKKSKPDEYVQSGLKTVLHSTDGNRHKYAVEFTKHGYINYLDGIGFNSFNRWWSKQFTAKGENDSKRWIFNNASDSGHPNSYPRRTTKVILHSLKIYKVLK
jgi:hypothetical protein